MMRRALGALLLAAAPATAEITAISYDEVAALTQGRVTFDVLPELPEPGHVLEHGYAFEGGRLGERFAGQALIRVEGPESPHDGLTGQPELPLRLVNGAPGQGLSVSFHRAFRSNALYPLGPLGYPHASARGEGSAAFHFPRGSCAFGLRLHTEYVDDLGTNTAHRGEVTLSFLSQDGHVLARQRLTPGGGISSYGYLSDGAPIHGVTVENRDPGGIALDDIRFGCPALLG